MTTLAKVLEVLGAGREEVLQARRVLGDHLDALTERATTVPELLELSSLGKSAFLLRAIAEAVAKDMEQKT